METGEIRMRRFGVAIEVKDEDLQPEWLKTVQEQLEKAKERIQRRMEYAIFGMDMPPEGESFREYLDQMECSSPEFREYIEEKNEPTPPSFDGWQSCIRVPILYSDKPTANGTVYPADVLQRLVGFWHMPYGNAPSSSGSSTTSSSEKVSYKFNGSDITDVISADEQTGEIHYYERHWSTNERIADGMDPTGYRTCREKGKVEIIKPPTPAKAQTGDTYDASDDYYKNNPWFHGCLQSTHTLRVQSSLTMTIRKITPVSSFMSKVAHYAVDFTPVVMDGVTGIGDHYNLVDVSPIGDDLVLKLSPRHADGMPYGDGQVNAYGMPVPSIVTFHIKSPQLRIPGVPSQDPVTWPANTTIEVRAGTAGSVDVDILTLLGKLKP